MQHRKKKRFKEQTFFFSPSWENPRATNTTQRGVSVSAPLWGFEVTHQALSKLITWRLFCICWEQTVSCCSSAKRDERLQPEVWSFFQTTLQRMIPLCVGAFRLSGSRAGQSLLERLRFSASPESVGCFQHLGAGEMSFLVRLFLIAVNALFLLCFES